MEDVRAVFEPALIWAYLVLEDFFFPYMNKEAWHVRGLESWEGFGFVFFFKKPIFGYPFNTRSLSAFLF